MGRGYDAFEHLDYPTGVVQGVVTGCVSLVAACQRTLDDHAGGADPWVWSARHAGAVLGFLACCRSPQDELRRPLQLMPWQRWIIGEVYGWVDPDTGVRRFREALVFVSQKERENRLVRGAHAV